jgi:hypothetical protein
MTIITGIQAVILASSVTVLTFVVQEEDFKAVEEKALKIGAASFECADVIKEFVEEVCRTHSACRLSHRMMCILQMISGLIHMYSFASQPYSAMPPTRMCTVSAIRTIFSGRPNGSY